MNLALVLFFSGAVVIIWIYLWSRQQRGVEQFIDVDQLMNDVPAAATGDALLIAQEHGKVIYANEPARRWLGMNGEAPHLEQIAQMVEPANNFLELFTTEGQSSFRLGQRWVQASSHRIPSGGEMRTVIVMRELSSATKSADLLDIDTAMSIINEIGETINAGMGVDRVLQTMLLIIKHAIGFDAGEISLWNNEEQALYQRGWVGDSAYANNIANVGGKYLIDEGISGWIARHREPIVLATPEDLATMKPKLVSAPYKSYLGVPLMLGERFIGTLEIANLQPNIYKQGDLALFQVISNPAAVAIYNAEIYEEQVQRIGDLASLQEVVTSKQADETDTVGVYHALNQRIAELVDADMSGIFLYDRDRNGLVPEIPFHGLPEALVRTIFIPLPDNSPQRNIWDNEPYWLTNDVANEPLIDEMGLRPVADVAGIRNTIWMPLQLKNQRIGILIINNTHNDDGFNERDIQNLTVLATQTAVVVENMRLYQREQRMDTELVGLQEITEAIGALTHEAEFYGEITERISKLMNIALCGILLYDEEKQQLVSKLPFYGVADEQIEGYAIHLTPGSIMAQLWEEESYWYSNRVQSDPLVFEAGLDVLAEKIGVQKTLMAVLHAGGQQLGVVQISNKLDGLDFTDSDARLLMIFATQSAAIIQNARLYREAQQSAEQAQGLRRVAELAGNVLTTQETFSPVLAEISALLDSEMVFINVLDQQKGSLVTYPRWIYGAELSEPIIQDIYGPDFKDSVVSSHRPYLGNDVLNDQNILPNYMQIAQKLGIQNAIFVPMIFGDRTLGELGIANRFSRPFIKEDIQVVQAVAAQTAAALDRLLLYEATGQNLSRRLDELDAISSVSNELTITLDLQQVIDVICQEAINATKADGSTVIIFKSRDQWKSDNEPVIEYRRGQAPETLTLADIEQVAVSHETNTVMVTDYESDPKTAFPPAAHSALAVPIMYLNQPVGIIHLFHNDPNSFDDRAAAFLITLSAKASLGYGNAMRYREQISRSDRLRRRIDQLNRIFELGHMFQTSNDPIDILEAIAYSIQNSVGYDTIVMTLIDQSTNSLHRVAHAGLPLEVFEKTKSHTINKNNIDELLVPEYRISESYFFPAEKRDTWATIDGIETLYTTYEGSRTIESAGPKMWHDGDMLLVSLYGPSGDLLGLISLDRPHDNIRPDRGTVEVLEIFANQAATMIENTRLYRSSMRNAEREAQLNEVMEAVSRTLDTTEIIRAVASGIRQILQFDQVTTALVDADNKGFDVMHISLTDAHTMDFRREHRDTLENTALHRTFTEHIDFIYGEDDEAIAQYDDLRTLHEAGEKTSLILPMMTGGEILGVVHIGTNTVDKVGLDEYRSLLKRMAQLIASAVQNARLFTQAVNLRVLNESVVESIQQGIVVLDAGRHVLSANEFMTERFDWNYRAIGQDLFTYRAQMKEILGEDLNIVLEQGVPRERINQNYAVTEDTTIISNFYLYPLRYGESVGGVVFLVEDVTERANLEQTMEARANQLAALTEVSNRITSSLEREEIVKLAMEEMGWLIPHKAITLWRRNGSYMVLEGASGEVEEISPDQIREKHVRMAFRDHQLARPVIETKRALAIGGKAKITDIIPVHKDIESWMGVPLVNQGHIVGLMMLTTDEPDAYENVSDQNIALAFASQVAIAEANADLFQQTFDRTNELGTLLEAAQATSLTTDLDSVFRVVVELMFNAIDVDNCTIMIWYEVDNEVEVQLDMNRAGESNQLIPSKTRLDLDLYPAKVRSLRDREVVVITVDDANNPYPKEQEELRDHNSTSRMLVPLVVRENSMGLVQLEQQSEEKTMTQQKIRLARALGAQVAVAIENARLSAETTAHFEESLVINDLSRAISSTLDLDDMIEIVRDQVPGVAGASELYLALYNPETQLITFPLAVKEGKPYEIKPRSLSMDEVSFIIRHRRPLNLGADYYSPDELRSSLGISNSEGNIKSYLGVPLMAGDEVYGVLAVRDTQRTRAFTINEQRTLTIVSSQLGAAIQNAQLYNRLQVAATELNQQVAERTGELENERDRLDTLYQITSELARTLDEERLMPNALNMVAKAIGAEDGVIMQLDPITDQLYSGAVLKQASLQKNPDSEHDFHPAEQLARRIIIEDEENLLVDDLLKTDYWDKKAPGAKKWRSALAVLLETNEELLGVMVLLSTKVKAFSTSHLRLVVAAANQVASSINNAQLYKLIRDQAERLGLLLRTEQESAEKNKAILEGIADGVILADDHGRIVLFNTAAERLMHVPREEALGHTLSELSGLEGISESSWAKALEGSLENLSNDVEGSFLDERITLGERTVSIHLSPVYTGERFLGTVSVFRDITREVLADRSKSEFVANVSHELRTPLTSIKGYNDLLIMGALGQPNDGQKQAFERIKDNVSRLTTLVEDVLRISQMDAGSEYMEIVDVDLNTITEQVLQHLKTLPQHQSKTLTINYTPNADLPAIQADRDKMIQVVHNLLDNAFNYTRDGGTIDIVIKSEADNHILLTIKDSGVGIPEEFYEKIWQRFERHEDTVLTLEVAGTGLGLPIVKEMVEIHSGKVWFESAVDEGTTFFVRLPLKQPEYMISAGKASSN
jgi:PAS domain S-box-containing protein